MAVILLFFYLSKLLFLGFLQFKGNGTFVRDQNNVTEFVKYRTKLYARITRLQIKPVQEIHETQASLKCHPLFLASDKNERSKI